MGKNGASFVKQAAILAGAGLLVRLIGFLYRLPMTDLIGDRGNGIYAMAYSVYTLLLTISAAALPAAISKMVSERVALGRHKDAHNVFKTALKIALISGTIGSVCLYIFSGQLSEFVGTPESQLSMKVLSPTVFIFTVVAVFRGYFHGLNSMMPTAISQVLEQIFNAVFSVYFAYVLIGKGVAFGAAGGTMGTGIGAFVGLVFVWFVYFLYRPILKRKIKKQKTKEESSWHIATTFILIAVPIVFSTAIANIPSLIDLKMVISRLLVSGYSLVEAESMSGVLSGKFTLLTTLPVAIATSLAIAVIPSISASIAKGESVEDKILTAYKLTAMIAMPSAAGLTVLADPILLMLFPTYSAGGDLLLFGASSVIFLSFTSISAGILQGLGKIYIPAICALIGISIKIVLNYVLIIVPSLNVKGAVISTVVCYAVASFLNIVILSHITRVRFDFVTIVLKPLFSSAAMAAGAFSIHYVLMLLTENNTISTLIAILAAVLLYGVMMILTKGLTEEDIIRMPMGRKIAKAFKLFGII